MNKTKEKLNSYRAASVFSAYKIKIVSTETENIYKIKDNPSRG
jgi:hypothetical protein